MRDAWSVGNSALPLVMTAIHAGHDLRPDLVEGIALDEQTRRREEDPFTDRIARSGGLPILVHRSRFEVDLNRPRHQSVYEDADAAWGLCVWREPLTDEQVQRSRHLHDAFYSMMTRILDDLAQYGRFIVLDVHSYNHRRDGIDRPSAPAEQNPEVNIGTGSLDRDRWESLVERFMDDLRRQVVSGHRLDVRENVRFEGGHLSRWVNARYPDTGCALAIELKKVFMDEWTGAVDLVHLEELATAFEATVPLLLGELVSGSR